MKFRKKPVVIEAVLYDGTRQSLAEVMAFTKELGLKRTVDVDEPGIVLKIETIEGTLTAAPGDYIIRDDVGEFYPCIPSIFAATYDPVLS